MNPTCPYCNNPATFRPDSEHLYGSRDFGPVWECAPCDARIGCAPVTNAPKGTLANAETRKLRQQAHKIFDPLWKGKMRRDNCEEREARTAGYEWLAAHLGIPYENCHISQMQKEQLLVVIDVSTRRARLPPVPPEEVR